MTRGGIAASGITVIINQASPKPRKLKASVGDVLQLMEQLDKQQRISVLDFMAREFGTRLVKELPSDVLHRVQRYTEAVLKGD